MQQSYFLVLICGHNSFKTIRYSQCLVHRKTKIMNNKLFTSLSIEQQESVSGSVTLDSLIAPLNTPSIPTFDIPTPSIPIFDISTPSTPTFDIPILDTFLAPREI